MFGTKKSAEYENKIKELESALYQARQESQLIQAEAQPRAPEGALNRSSSAPRVDPVEHQVLRQEVESLRRTVADLQQELDNTNDQARQAEDQLEDKNTLIENLRRDLEGMQGNVNRADDRRRKAEEARLQSDTKLSVLQERMDAGLGPLPQKTGPGWMGVVLGLVLLFAALEAISFGLGRGELVSLIVQGAGKTEQTVKSQATQTQGAEPEQPVAVSEPKPEAKAIAEPEPKPEVPEPGIKLDPALGMALARDGGALVEDAGFGYPLVSLQAGAFQMGNRTGAVPEESPVHMVNLRPFLIGRNEVTFDLYDRFAKATGRSLPNDEGWGRGQQPVINISWDDAQALAIWLSEQTGKGYRLPSEAEWEYAASGGRDSAYWWGDAVGENHDNCFNCKSRWDRVSPAPINSFAPNPFGLVNTAGNVQEWVADCYRAGYAEASGDGSAVDMPVCLSRVIRGGAFNKPADSMKRTRRNHLPSGTRLNNLGLRLVREP